MKTTLIILFAAVVGVYGDASTCGTLNGQCGNNGKCVPECVATGDAVTGTTPCTSSCATDESCSWKCENVASTCSAVSASCGNNGGTCATECVTTGDEQGTATPSCTASPCDTAGGETCSWKCQSDADVCTTVDQACGTNSKCGTECAASPGIPGAGTPTCSAVCPDGESCSWKCPHDDANVCATVDQSCGTNSKCATECAASPGIPGADTPTCSPSCTNTGENCSWKCQAETPGSGTSRPALLLPLTILGTLLKMQCILE